ncbi:TBC domain-containing protein kinase-like protein [Durusdinium trenchii]|uniref:TBC domain-containing protein kinase-like protein n=1 Tax=Durusdinium trenchii TaxID=1381693 RepID=A0ABP0PUM5_9DINO
MGHLLGGSDLSGMQPLTWSPLTPADPCCLSPEVAGEHLKQASCQPDVWSLGIVLLQMLQGPWSHLLSEAPSERRRGGLVAAETAAELWRFANSSVSTANPGLTLPVVLNWADMGDGSAGSALPIPQSLQMMNDASIIELQGSYRQWLKGEGLCSGGLVNDFWEECVTLRPSQRPRPQDLASHACMAQPDLVSAAGVWTVRGDANLYSRDDEAPPEAASQPQRYLQSMGVDLAHLSYWWHLAGGSPYRVAAERLLLRPTPAIFRLPLFVLDSHEEEGHRSTFLSEEMTTATSRPSAKTDATGMQFWDPPPEAPLGFFSVDLTDLCQGLHAADRANAKDLRPESLYERHQHFAYQWLRVKQFQRLLAALTHRRVELFREASEDLPPLLRSSIWSALLGGAPLLESDEACWSPFYEHLLTTPLGGGFSDGQGVGNYLLERPSSGGTGRSFSDDERWKVAMRSVPRDSFDSSDSNRRFDRLIHALLAANPDLQHPEGLGALCCVVTAVFQQREEAAFLALQRLLHGFLWPLYGPDGLAQRRRSLQIFGTLMSFADPQLALHLHELGMQPDAYASDWLCTWFAKLLPLPQAILLWDTLLLHPPQFQLFVGLCLVHFFRESLLSLNEASQIATFLSSCAQLVDIQVLVTAARDFFQALPASLTLPVYPRHSAGEALLWEEGAAPIAADPSWGYLNSMLGGQPQEKSEAQQKLAQHATEQWRQCEWWRQRSKNVSTPPIITVDDFLSYRSRCFILDVRPTEEFDNCHFQSSIHVSDPEAPDLLSSLPPDFVSHCGTPREAQEEPASPWLFATSRLRLVVVIGAEDFGIAFADRLLNAGIRHVLCLLGGIAGLREQAPTYLTRVDRSRGEKGRWDGVLSHRAGMDTLQRAAKPIWDKAESYVQTKLRCHCFLCSSLLRRYGDAGIRTSIQAHFDEYAFATAIVSLDKLSDFSGGLVVQAQPAEHSRRLVELDLGDLVLHSYDLLHSVDVQGGTRHSLIMWFSTSRAACHKAQTPWKRKYARLGEPNAQYQYARSLIFNSGEAAQGWRWLAQAASKGQSTAQLNWGLRQMQEGRRARAQHWWRRAARQGVKEAAHNLGLSFLESGSFKSALRWLRRAAHMGDADAEALLGGCLDFHPPCVA